MTNQPDFDRLRAKRDAGIEKIARAVHVALEGDPGATLTFHSRDHGSPCYCGCPDGPCEHDFQGAREFEDGLGSEQFCARCGEGAMSHSMRFGI